MFGDLVDHDLSFLGRSFTFHSSGVILYAAGSENRESGKELRKEIMY